MGVKQRAGTLSGQNSPLSDTFYQLDVLNGKISEKASFEPFSKMLAEPLTPIFPQVFQVNIGKLCNQSCAHCHVDAGPDRKKENMDRETLELCLDILSRYPIPAVDITGGAPELNPNFKWFVESCRKLGKKVMNRCNLTIIESHPRFHDLPDFFAANEVHVVSSLPYFSKNRTDAQRGEGVFEDSIKALQRLNHAGYGVSDSSLVLDLVYNPSGAFLPGQQAALEKEFKSQLGRKFGISFNNLLVITNLPVSRFLDYLISSGNYESYMETLIEAYNPATVEGLMCRYTLSVSWDGYIYDCDFNQMLDMKVSSPSRHLSQFDMDQLMSRQIAVNQHCYGCTAGAGSSCGGEITG